MRSVALTEVEERLGGFCDEIARTGEEIVIERDGKPLARLAPVCSPASSTGSEVWDAVREWEAAHGDEDVELELPSRNDAHRSPMGPYWQ